MSRFYPKHMIGQHYPKHMAESNMPGLMRLIFSIIVSAVLLPVVLRLYLNVAPGATAKDYWNAFIQTAPFGNYWGSMIVSVWNEVESSLWVSLDGMLNHKGDFTLYFSMEMGQLAFSGIILILLSSVLEKILPIRIEAGMLNNAANAVFQLLLAFVASLIVDYIFRFFQENLINMDDVIQMVVIWVYIVLLFGGATITLVVFGMVFYIALFFVCLGCMKLCVSYCILLWLLQSQMVKSSPIMMILGVIIWLAAIWLIQAIEKIILPQ